MHLFFSWHGGRGARLLAALLLGAAPALAQSVGIGTSSPSPAAALDITAAGKGLLIPRLDSASRVAIASPPTGLLVFQTSPRVGFYYYGGGSWLFLPDKARTGDNLGSHTATQALNLQANALTGTGSSIGGVGVGVRADGGLNLGQRTGNVLLGFQAGPAAKGSQNVFVGFQSGLASTDGNGNTALGYGAGPTSAALTNATALGANARVSQDNSLILGAGARVGIGTSAPASLLDVRGSATVSESVTTPKVLTPATGPVNMLPIAYGAVYANADPIIGSGNARVKRQATGSYLLGVDGIPAGDYATCLLQLNLFKGGGSPGTFLEWSHSFFGAALAIYAYRFIDGVKTPVDQDFSFVVYRP